MKNSIFKEAIKYIAIIGFILSIFSFRLGCSIAFLFTGLYLFLEIKKNSRVQDVMFGIISISLSLYFFIYEI